MRTYLGMCWDSLYREIYHNLTHQQHVDLVIELCCLEQGIEVLEELKRLSKKYKFVTMKELETILEKGGIKK